MRLQDPASNHRRNRHSVIKRGAARDKPVKVRAPEVTICITISQEKTSWCRWRQTLGRPLNKIRIFGGNQVNFHCGLVSVMVETTLKRLISNHT